jgi:hypothetical protein
MYNAANATNFKFSPAELELSALWKSMESKQVSVKSYELRNESKNDIISFLRASVNSDIRKKDFSVPVVSSRRVKDSHFIGFET